ncbi:MAG: metallophosphoesterase [Thermoplasmatales archaeon]|nr:MAG: metallophosphoesterase [Thermoplasmatales archaeon]
MNNYVEYGQDSTYGYIKEGLSNCNHHEIIIKPSFNHGHYRVVSNGIISDDFEFKLGSYFYDNNSFKCAFIGDSRGMWDNWEQAKIVANAVNNGSSLFVIHGGDMVDDGRILTQWDSWLNLMMPLMQNSTVFGVLGNHEKNGDRYFEIFSLPNNEKWYSFDYGPCHFIILDQYEPFGKGTSQYKWLVNDLATTSALFRIVCFHEPIYCKGGHSPRTDIKVIWEPLFIKYNVRLVVQSHCHFYQRTDKIENIYYVVTGGAGAPLYNPGDDWFVNISKKAYHYCLLEYNSENSLRFSAYYINGSVFDEIIINPISSPNPPKITGPKHGNPGVQYDYVFRSYDPNDDNIFLWVDWDDGTEEGWFGPYESGIEIFLNHTWENKMNYLIKAKSKDINGEESDWTTHTMIMPRDKISFNSFFFKLFNLIQIIY